MKKAGITEEQIHTMLVETPRDITLLRYQEGFNSEL